MRRFLRLDGYSIERLTQRRTFAAIIIGCLVAITSMTAWCAYDRANYQWILGAELQALATIIALVASGTLVAGQIGQNATPRVTLFLPIEAFWLTGGITFVALSLDVFMLASLPVDANRPEVMLINSVVVLNGFALAIVAAYVRLVLDWMQPSTYLEALRWRLERTRDFKGQSAIVSAMESLGGYVAERRQIDACSAVNVALANASIDLVRQRPDLQEVQQYPDHPLVVAVVALGRLGSLYAEKGLDDAFDPIASLLGHVAIEFGTTDDQYLDAYFVTALDDIGGSCVRHRRDFGYYNFLANKTEMMTKMADQQRFIALQLWVYSMREDAERTIESNMPNSADEAVEGLNTLIDLIEQGLPDSAARGGANLVFNWRSIVTDAVTRCGSAMKASRLQSVVPRFGTKTLLQRVEELETRLSELNESTV